MDQSRATRVDVLMAVKAPAPWLQETLESLTRQSFTQWKLVLVMDGYSAEIDAICRRALPGFDPLSVESGSGMVGALNRGLASCEADYVARIDADDIALPDRFARQARFLDDHPDHVAVGTGYEEIDAEGRVLVERPLEVQDPARTLGWYNPLAHPSMLLRRTALLSAGGYNPAAKHLEDYDLWLRLAAIGQIGVIREPLVQYRRHDNQVTRTFGYSREARTTLLQSRIALARAGGRSPLAARLRHQVWSAVNYAKGR